MPRRPSPITVLLEQLEQNPTLDELAAVLSGPMGAAFGSGPLGETLRGRALGHALHPLLVQVPLGAILSASVLDLLQGRNAGAQSRLLMGVACLSIAPAAVTGWAEWVRADDRTKRVGVLHAGFVAAAGVSSILSFLLRGRRWTPAAAVLTGVAGTAFAGAGLLGGHLSLVRKYASHDLPSDGEGIVHGRLSG